MGEQVSVYFEDEVKKEVQNKADKENRSFSSMTNILLKKALGRKK